MNLIKRHKGLALVGALTLVLIIIMFILCGRMIFSTGETIYGSRLKNLPKIDSKVTKEIINENKEIEEIEKQIFEYASFIRKNVERDEVSNIFYNIDKVKKLIKERDLKIK